MSTQSRSGSVSSQSDDHSKKSKSMLSRAFSRRKPRSSKSEKVKRHDNNNSDVSSNEGAFSVDSMGMSSAASSALTSLDLTLGTVDDEIEAFLEVEKLGDIATQKGDYYQAKNSYEVASNLLRKVLKPDHPHILRTKAKLEETILTLAEISSQDSRGSRGRLDAKPEFVGGSRNGIKKFFTENRTSREGQNMVLSAQNVNSTDDIVRAFKHHERMGEESLQFNNSADALFHYKQMLNLIRQIGEVEENVLLTKGILINEAKILDVIGEINVLLKNKDAALTAFIESVDIRKRTSADKVALSATHHKIGRIYESLGMLPLAQRHYKKSIRLKKQNHKDMIKNVFSINSSIPTKDGLNEDISSQQCTVYNRIGIQLAKKESYKEALEFFHTSVLNLSTSKGDHVDIDAMTYNNIGNAYSNTKNDEQTPLEYYLMALKSSTSKDPFVRAGALYNCGVYYNKKGRLDKANMCFEDALLCYENMYEENIFDKETKILLSNILNNIGNMCYNDEDYETSSENYKLALEMKIEVYGEHSEEIFGTLCNVGSSLLQQKEFTSATEYFQKALKIVKTKEGNELREANVWNKLGNVNLQTKSFTKAYDYYTKALTIKRKILRDNNHEEVLLTLTNIAQVFYRQGKLDQAIKTYDTVYKRRMTNSDEETVETGKIVLDTAYVHLEKKEIDVAIELCEKATTIFDGQKLPADHKFCRQVRRLRRKLPKVKPK